MVFLESVVHACSQAAAVEESTAACDTEHRWATEWTADEVADLTATVARMRCVLALIRRCCLCNTGAMLHMR